MAPLQALVENPLPHTSRAHFIGLIGDHPSTYARSPRIWRPALEALGIDAAYLALDVRPDRLRRLVDLLRRAEACLGANVTVPYKDIVWPLLDDVDAAARPIGAVNTIVRTPDGRLIGANTDGAGLVSALLHPDAQAGTPGPPVVTALHGAIVLLIGAGGAGCAAALALAPRLGSGELLVTNRGHARARALAEVAALHGCRATAIPDRALEGHLPRVTLVINASTRGQAGIVKNPRGRRRGWTCLEPYSALASASPATAPPMPEERFLATWSARSRDDIAANHARSRARIQLLPPTAAVYDMVYAPQETILLRHAREAGLRAANGRGMNVAQAVAACVDHICRPLIAGRGIDPEGVRALVMQAMAGAWGA